MNRRIRRLATIGGCIVAIFCVIVIVLSMLHKFCLKPSDGAAIFAGLLAFVIVWWQGYLIKEQMQLSTIIELYGEWNSKEMLEKRKLAWKDQHSPDRDTIEDVLEFLEKVSTFEERGVISTNVIWETFGWYISRYYCYSKSEIDELRREWTPGHPDLTLYEDLQVLYPKLLDLEVARRNKKAKDWKQPTGTEKMRGEPDRKAQEGEKKNVRAEPDKKPRKLIRKDIEKELKDTRERFIRSERGVER
jgi:hypothetical protein